MTLSPRGVQPLPDKPTGPPSRFGLEGRAWLDGFVTGAVIGGSLVAVLMTMVPRLL